MRLSRSKYGKSPEQRTDLMASRFRLIIKEGKRLIGYDNAEGKDYHRHFMNREEEYRFSDIWKLLDDFKKDLTTLRGRNWDEG